MFAGCEELPGETEIYQGRSYKVYRGMGYLEAKNLEELFENANFVVQSAAGLRESHPHDIAITKEAPNYSVN